MSAAAEPGRDPILALAGKISASLGEPFEGLARLGQGQGAQVYAFRCKGRDWVLRVAPEARHVASERQAHRLFGARLSVPAVWLEGSWLGLHWAIIGRCRGQSLDHLPAAGMPALAPDLFALHRQLILSPVPRSMLPYVAQWRGYLGEYRQQDFDARRHHDPSGWLNPKRINQAIAALRQVLKASPEYPDWFHQHPVWFCHGDFKPSNFCGEAGRITGLFDWSELNVTDYLYDPACWLLQLPASDWAFWRRGFRQVHAAIGLDTRAWDERLRACMLRKLITTLLHASRSGEAAEFTLADRQLSQLLTEAQSSS